MLDWTGLKVQVEPTVEPVTVAELKTYMRLDGSTYDTMLGGYLTACRQAVEKHTGRTLINTTRVLYRDGFPPDNETIELPYGPVQSISSIVYIDENGDQQTWAAANYYFDAFSVYARITPAHDVDWPDTQDQINAVKVTYVAGYGAAASAVPAPLKECIKALVSDLFEHPEANVEMTLAENRTYKFLLNAYSIPGIV